MSDVTLSVKCSGDNVSRVRNLLAVFATVSSWVVNVRLLRAAAVVAAFSLLPIGSSFGHAVDHQKTKAPVHKVVSRSVDGQIVSINAARKAALRGDHLRSAGIFQKVMATSPGRRGALLEECADQLALAGAYAEAAASYRELVSKTKAGTQKRQRLQAKVASVSSMAGRRARAVKTSIKADHQRPRLSPEKQDARDRLSQIPALKKWQAARVDYQETPKQGPATIPVDREVDQTQERHHRDAQAILAQTFQPERDDLPARQQALGADGSPGEDPGMNNLGLALGQRQIFSDLRSLRDRILDAERPVTNLDTRQSTQTDHVDITQAEASQDLFFDHGRNRLRVGVQSATYSPQAGSNTSVYSLGGNGTYRFNDWVSITGDLWLNSIDGSDFSGRQITTYDTFVTLWPNDVVRVDLDANRKTFDNIKSLRAGITADTYGASVDYMPINTLRFTARGSSGSYSDSNERQSLEGETVWRVRESPMIEVGVRASGFHYSKLLDNGYFNPDRYASAEGMFRIQSQFTEKLAYEFAISGGSEWVEPGDSKPLLKSSAQLVYQLTPDVSLDGGLSYFSSRESNSSGFARTTLMLGLHFRPGQKRH